MIRIPRKDTKAKYKWKLKVTVESRWKVYVDPAGSDAPVVMGYKGITQWTQKVNDDMKATLAKLDFNALTEEEKKAYQYFQENIRIFEETGKDPMECGFFYCPYLPEGIPEELKDKPFLCSNKPTN